MALSPRNKYADKAKGLLARQPHGHPPPARNMLPVAPHPSPPRPPAPARPPALVRPAAPQFPSIYAPMTPDQIDAQARSQTYGPYNGIIDATVNGLLGKAAYQSDAERAQTSRLMAALAPYANRIRGIFDPASQQAAATGQGIGGQLAAQGGQLSGELGAKLAGIQAPGQAVDQFAGGANRVGQAAGATVGALGTAEADRLHGVGEANAGWAAAQPGVAQLESLARLGLIQQDLGGNLASQIGNLQIEAQRAYMDRVDKLQGLEYDKAQARQGIVDKRTSAKQEAVDRQMEAVALKLSYGMKLTPREQYLLSHYGMSAGTAQTLIRGNAAAAGDTRDAALAAQKARWTAAQQRANNAATAARQAAHDAAAAQRQAQHDAAVAAQHQGDNAARAKLQQSRNRAAAARQRAHDTAVAARQAAHDAQVAKGKYQKASGAANSPDSRSTGTTGGTGYFPGG